MTGAPSVESATVAIEEGIFRYLWKPVVPEKLLEVVQRAAATGRLGVLKREAVRIVGEGNAEGSGDNAGLMTRFENAVEHLWMAFFSPSSRIDEARYSATRRFSEQASLR